MGDIKARDIIPGWPRGRSTSRPLAKGSAWPWKYAFSLTTGEFLGEYGGSDFEGLSRRPWPADSKTLHLDWAAREQERVGNQAEELRKAEMMEMYYVLKRIGGEQASDWPECLFDLIVGLGEP